MADAILLLLLLVGLELVLGVDNILVISIFVGRLPQDDRNRARVLGLAFALIARVLMLAVLVKLAGLTDPIVLGLSMRDLVLLAGGLFLLYKAVTEIHHTVELKEELHQADHVGRTFAAVVTQIVVLDIVFSIDSVVTAIGLTNKLWVIISAVVLSFGAILTASRPIGDFILHRPTLKILALAFLITIGVTIFMEGLHQHVPKAYIYLPMGFALGVEMLQLRYESNRMRRLAGRERASEV